MTQVNQEQQAWKEIQETVDNPDFYYFWRSVVDCCKALGAEFSDRFIFSKDFLLSVEDKWLDGMAPVEAAEEIVLA